MLSQGDKSTDTRFMMSSQEFQIYPQTTFYREADIEPMQELGNTEIVKPQVEVNGNTPVFTQQTQYGKIQSKNRSAFRTTAPNRASKNFKVMQTNAVVVSGANSSS